MGLVCRITQAESLTRRKLNDLHALCKALGKVRAYVWRKYGSIKSVGKTLYAIRDEVCRKFKDCGIAAHVLQCTVMDTANSIKCNREASKVKVVRAIFKKVSDPAERKALCAALKTDRTKDEFKSWTEISYLRRQMRKHCRRGHSKCVNQIVVPPDSYRWFTVNGRGFLKITGFVQPTTSASAKVVRHISIPLTTNIEIKKNVRVIINGDAVEIHYWIPTPEARPCGTQLLAVDKGYTEVFVDSDGDSHGNGLGSILNSESDYRKKFAQARHRLRGIAVRSDASKESRIRSNNLGLKSSDRRINRHQQMVSTIVHGAVHSVIDKASVIVAENLPNEFKSKKLNANTMRRLSGWTKGVIASALKNVASRRGASVKLVNAAYTSQICPDCGCFGRRKGDQFYCDVCRDVKRSDHVSARNVLARLNDKEIERFMPYREVKVILLARISSRLRLSNPDSSCTNAAYAAAVSTESELPAFGNHTLKVGSVSRHYFSNVVTEEC